jgi:hypothetical protein
MFAVTVGQKSQPMYDFDADAAAHVVGSVVSPPSDGGLTVESTVLSPAASGPGPPSVPGRIVELLLLVLLQKPLVSRLISSAAHVVVTPCATIWSHTVAFVPESFVQHTARPPQPESDEELVDELVPVPLPGLPQSPIDW